MKIVSGGQTGVDRAALDFAIRRGLPHGGWCPLGRKAEDGVIPERYGLVETDSGDPAVRTERNVIDSDGTLVVVRDGTQSEGTELTLRCAHEHGRPCLVVHETGAVPDAAARLADFVRAHSIVVLNVAGPRESEAPGLGGFAGELLAHALSLPGTRGPF